MARIDVGSIEIEYEELGSGEPLLLIMGLGGQLTDWHPEFVDRLADRFHVIRFDNRDIGLSTYSDAPAPTKWDLFKANLPFGTTESPYALDEMADDAGGLLEALDIDSAHVVGMSMGGMIAQLLTTRQPDRVRSLCSIMSNTGDGRHGLPAPRLLPRLLRRGQPDRHEALDIIVETFRIIGGPDWDEDEQRERSAASLDRAYNPAGLLRQSLAIAAAADRTAALRRVTQPTLVIHGLADPLVRPSGGVATAKAVYGSRLLMYPGMGHDIPVTRQPEIVEAIERNVDRS